MSDQSQKPNPYAPPTAPTDLGPTTGTGGGGLSQDTCPRCKSTNVQRPGFTWWGGAIGPKLLSHAHCKGCGFGYNWKTGNSNTTAIVIYTAVIFAIVIAIYAAVGR